ncbi:MAG TPA: PIN domain-containing protein [Ramlibacter sp.]|uniref:type II toxin-antitoxin system VapC family toxin n=1 Tax=Ramlibacter sp. TaxID=1917967 RepID=UPI002ED18429
MIADSSAWIEFLRGRRSAAARRLEGALRASETILMPDIVFQEVLQGASDTQHFLILQEQLEAVTPLTLAAPRETARHAAWIYAKCRWAGVTLRSPNDCLIACCAVEADAPLLHADRDFERIAAVEPRLRFA